MTGTEGPRRPPTGEIAPWLILGGSTTVLLGVGVTWSAAWAATQLDDGFTPSMPRNPFTYTIGLVRGSAQWPGTTATVLVVMEVLLLTAAAFGLWRALRRGNRVPSVDRAARHLGHGSALAKLSWEGAAATAARLGVQSQTPGVFIGRSVTGGVDLYGSWEDMHVDIWGPRTGKTTRRAIPAICNAPGAVLVTSNKRDIVDATRGPRVAAGDVWVFDPQSVADEDPVWYWNPLTYVTGVATARKMAAHFALGSRSQEARTDAYFDPAGQDLVANLLLAAAEGDYPLTHIYSWLTNPKDDEPARILRDAGHDMPADSVEGVIAAPEKQRGGIYGTAAQMVSFLLNPSVHPWISAEKRPGRREFHPAKFIASGGTLYSLSREGRDSAGPLVTALTVAVVEAAETAATRQPGGRLAVPLLGVLDEAANVCRWGDLPDLYSHYGSRGIILMTILQSWDQGVEVWGERGMAKLWSAANVRTYGGGASSTNFLGDLSQLAGEHEVHTISTSYQPPQQGGMGLFNSKSTSHSTRRERVLEVSDLGAMPPGRALVLASGTPPALVATIPWWETEHADAISASLATHNPTPAA